MREQSPHFILKNRETPRSSNGLSGSQEQHWAMSTLDPSCARRQFSLGNWRMKLWWPWAVVYGMTHDLCSCPLFCPQNPFHSPKGLTSITTSHFFPLLGKPFGHVRSTKPVGCSSFCKISTKVSVALAEARGCQVVNLWICGQLRPTECFQCLSWTFQNWGLKELGYQPVALLEKNGPLSSSGES